MEKKKFLNKCVESKDLIKESIYVAHNFPTKITITFSQEGLT